MKRTLKLTVSAIVLAAISTSAQAIEVLTTPDLFIIDEAGGNRDLAPCTVLDRNRSIGFTDADPVFFWWRPLFYGHYKCGGYDGIGKHK